MLLQNQCFVLKLYDRAIAKQTEETKLKKRKILSLKSDDSEV